MKLRPLLALTLLLSFCSVYGEDRGSNIHGPIHQVEKKLITTPVELEKLGLFGTDFHSQEYLDEMLASFWEGIESNNYYLIFYKSLSGPDRKVSQIRSNKLTLKGYIRISKGYEKCSTYQALNHSVIKLGLGLNSAVEGICGEIAIIHSLKKIGLKKAPFRGKYIKEIEFSDLAEKKSKNGMSAKELALAQQKFTGKSCEVYSHVCDFDTSRFPPPHKEKIENLAKKGLKTFVAKLYRQMNHTKPKYVCSLGIRSYNREGRKLFSHFEHITKVALNPRNKKAVILTKNGLVQGDMKKTVPAHAGINTYSIDPENLKCNFERSSHRAINRIYKGISLTHVDAVCCPY